MRKFITVSLLFFLSVSVFAFDLSLSAGGGGLLGYTFTRYTLKGGDVNSTQNMDRFDYAFFLFFDATYAEFTVMFKGGNSSYKEEMAYIDSAFANDKGTGSETSIVFSLMGKYPFIINESFTWFPMVGIEYQAALSQYRTPDGDSKYDRTGNNNRPADRDKNDNNYPISAWNSFWINIGAGADYYLTEKFYLRGEFLFGFRLMTDYERGALDVVKKQTGISNPRLAGLTGSPMLKLAAGYKIR